MESSSGKKRVVRVNPLRELFTMGPANYAHEVAIRCGISVFLPLLILLLIDRVELSIFASFGAFPAIYGRNFQHGPRFKMQLRAGVLMAAVLLLGSLAGRSGFTEAENPWGLVLATSLIAGLVSFVVAYWRLRPLGSLFYVFAFAAVASVPHQPPWPDVLLVVFPTIVFSLLVGISSRLLFWRAKQPFVRPKDEPIGPQEHRAIISGTLWHIIAAGAAGAIATALGPVLDMEHNYWAMVAAVTPLVGHRTRARVTRGTQRVIGTFLGLVLMALILFLQPSLWVLVMILALLQSGAELFAARQYVLTQILVTPMALLSAVVVSAALDVPIDSNQLLKDRALETIIGAVVGIACVMIPWAWQRWVRKGSEPEILIETVQQIDHYKMPDR